MAALEAGLLVREDHLEEQHRKLESVRLVAVKNEAALELPAVLQTYVIPLQGVRQELAAWVPPMTDDYQSLIKETRALSRRTMEELETDLLFEAMEVAPGILVPIMKAPYMERNELVLWSAVIGLKLSSEALQARRSPRTCSLAELNGTTIRCPLRKAAAMSWEIATCDVKMAFLLAPREDSNRRLVVVKAPHILVK